MLPFFRTSLCAGVLNSAIFNSFHNWVEFGTILEGLQNFGGGDFEHPTPPRYVTGVQRILLLLYLILIVSLSIKLYRIYACYTNITLRHFIYSGRYYPRFSVTAVVLGTYDPRIRLSTCTYFHDQWQMSGAAQPVSLLNSHTKYTYLSNPCTCLNSSCWIQGVEARRFPDNWHMTVAKVVRPTHRPPLPPREYSWYSFLLEAESTSGAIVRPEGLCQ